MENPQTQYQTMEIRLVIRNSDIYDKWKALKERISTSYQTEAFKILMRNTYKILHEGYKVDWEQLEQPYVSDLKPPYEIRIKLYTKEDKERFRYLIQAFDRSSKKETRENIKTNDSTVRGRRNRRKKSSSLYVEIARYVILIFSDLVKQGKAFSLII